MTWDYYEEGKEFTIKKEEIKIISPKNKIGINKYIGFLFNIS